MDEFGFPHDDDFTDFEKYIIGFTENQYVKSKDKSPSPADQTPRHSSMALEYAERSNKVAENIFQDRSLLLDRKKTRSMSKINGNMLDLVFELTERRKYTNPLQRSFNSNGDQSPRDSNMSDTSMELEQPPSPTFPTIQVQQLPPLFQPMDRLLPILPDIYMEPVSTAMKPKKKKVNKGNANLNRFDKLEPGAVKIPKLVNVVKECQLKHQLENKHVSKPDDIGHTAKDKTTTEITELPATAIATENRNATANDSKFVKWQNVTNKLVVTFKQVKESPEDFNVYSRRKSMSRSSDGHFRKSSFCQSSYQERADRERSNNIRRRHSLQTKTGPLDFNKLRRQISFGRSNTVVW